MFLYPTINNTVFAYYLRWYFPANATMMARAVLIEYTYTGPH